MQQKEAEVSQSESDRGGLSLDRGGLSLVHKNHENMMRRHLGNKTQFQAES